MAQVAATGFGSSCVAILLRLTTATAHVGGAQLPDQFHAGQPGQAVFE